MRSGTLSDRLMIQLHQEEIRQVLSYLSWSRFMLVKLGNSEDSEDLTLDDSDDLDDEDGPTTSRNRTQNVIQTLENLEIVLRAVESTPGIIQRYILLYNKNLTRSYQLDRNTFIFGFDTTTTEQILALPWARLIALGGSLDRRLPKRLGNIAYLKPQVWVEFLQSITQQEPTYPSNRIEFSRHFMEQFSQNSPFSDLFLSNSLPPELRDTFRTWFERAALSLRVTAPWLAKYCKMEKVYSK
jgi:hypothetical protein